jgi:hypothetical protein
MTEVQAEVAKILPKNFIDEPKTKLVEGEAHIVVDKDHLRCNNNA